MQAKYKLIVGSLVGAIAIHLAFVACGHAMHTTSQPGDAGADEGLFDALVDHVTALLDGTTKDAKADTDSGSGACGCTVAGPIQSVPASENPSQLVRGNVSGLTVAGAGAIVVTGPFVLTDATSLPEAVGTAAGASLVIQPAAASCTAVSGSADTSAGYVTSVQTVPPLVVAVHGGRYVVPAGQMLCAYNPFSSSATATGGLQWAGFVPYP